MLRLGSPLLVLGAWGRTDPNPKKGPPVSTRAAQAPVTSGPRALAPAVGDARSGAHTLTPRFVYPGCGSRCPAKPHRHLVPADVNQPSPPAKPLTAAPPPPPQCPTHIVPFDEALPLAQISLHLGGQQDRAEQRHGAKRPSLERLDRHTRAGGGKEGRPAGGEPSWAHMAPALRGSGSLDTPGTHGWQWLVAEPNALARGPSAF